MFKWDNFGLQIDLVTLIMAGVLLLMFILVIVLFAKISGLKNKYRGFMNGSDARSLEQAFVKKFENMDFINGKLSEIDDRLDRIDSNLLITFQKVSLIRYDAFKAGGGQLSFVLTMLNKVNDGFILNTVHSNSAEGYFSYIKEVKGGQVSVELSEEEERSLEQALMG